jgi:hypothetical protein
MTTPQAHPDAAPPQPRRVVSYLPGPMAAAFARAAAANERSVSAELRMLVKERLERGA